MALGAARSRLIRQMLVESVLLGCAGGVVGVAVAYAGARMILALAFPGFAAIAHSCQPFSGGARFRVCTVAADWRCIRHRSRVDHLALRSGGSFARNQSLDERPGFTAAEVAHRAAGRTFAGVAGGSRLAHAEPAQPSASGFRNRYRQPLRRPLRSRGRRVTRSSTIPALNERLEREFSRSARGQERRYWPSTARWKAITGARACLWKAGRSPARGSTTSRPGTE